MTESKIIQLEKEIRKLKKLVYLDPLTNVYNRRGFLEIGGNYFKSFKEGRDKHRKNEIKNLALIFLDIDDFKKINDQYGHQKGDKVLKYLAQFLKHIIRKTDLLSRWGGEEFVILLLNIDPINAKRLAHKICTKIKAEKMAGIHLTVSAGLIIPHKKDNLAFAINQADKLMYQAKKRGKNQYVTTIRGN
jgi:diguanylate cyclase (GGDEF)-like protein